MLNQPNIRIARAVRTEQGAVIGGDAMTLLLLFALVVALWISREG